MKPTQERRNQFLNHLWDYIQDEDTNSGRLLLDRLIDLIDERIDERLAKPPIPEPGQEVAETKTEDSGDDGNITPAGPLREIPEKGELYYHVVTFKKEFTIWEWEDDPVDIIAFQAGLCFPLTPEGELGAEIRANQGILPPIDREGGEDA